MSGFFAVKNFEKFQHYKDRSPPWIRLYNVLLDDYEFGKLEDASKAHLIAIWLLASRYDNKIPFDLEWVSRHINATCAVDLLALEKSGFIIVDQACSETLAERKQDAKPEERRGDTFSLRSKVARERETEFSETFWPAYPNKVGRPKALTAFISARRKADLAAIMRGVERYVSSKPGGREWLNPATFLNQERWADTPASAAEKPKLNGHPGYDPWKPGSAADWPSRGAYYAKLGWRDEWGSKADVPAEFAALFEVEIKRNIPQESPIQRHQHREEKIA